VRLSASRSQTRVSCGGSVTSLLQGSLACCQEYPHSHGGRLPPGATCARSWLRLPFDEPLSCLSLGSSLNVSVQRCGGIHQNNTNRHPGGNRANRTFRRTACMAVLRSFAAISSYIVESTTSSCIARHIAGIYSQDHCIKAWFSPHCLNPQASLFANFGGSDAA
jgi:hypothetical protein